MSDNQKDLNETLDELDKQIEELNAINILVDNEDDKKANAIKEKTIAILNNTKDRLVKLYNEVQDPNKQKEAIEFVKRSSKELKDKTFDAIDSFINNEKVQHVYNVSKEFVKDTYDKTKTYLQSDDFKQVVDSTKHVISKGVEACKEKGVQQYRTLKQENQKFNDVASKVETAIENVSNKVKTVYEKPEVQAKINNAKQTTIEVAEKALEKLKKWLNTEDNK